MGKRALSLLAVLALGLFAASCGAGTPTDASKGEAPPQKESSVAAEPPGPLAEPDASEQALPEEYIDVMSKDSIYFANVSFVPEFSLYNEGGVHRDLEKGTITIGVTKATGTATGAVDGPNLSFTVDLAERQVLERTYTPPPDEENFRQSREDEGSLESISDQRLTEIADLFQALFEEHGY